MHEHNNNYTFSQMPFFIRKKLNLYLFRLYIVKYFSINSKHLDNTGEQQFTDFLNIAVLVCFYFYFNYDSLIPYENSPHTP